MDPARAQKLGGRIAQIVAEMLERRIKDPRLGFVTVTAARLTNDLREATVFYTVYGSAEERAGTAAALASAVGVIRSEVGRQTGLRHTPSPDNARNIEELVARAREADAAVAAAREGAQPAGDADPYRVPAGAGEDSLDEDSLDEGSLDEDSADGGFADREFAAGGFAGEDFADEDSADGNFADRSPAGQTGQDDHLAETPAARRRGAGYSRS
jgi:ribosome-binding factor A